MKALTWKGRQKVSVENVPDPRIEEQAKADGCIHAVLKP